MDRIKLVGGGQPAVPESFRAKLKALDPNLCVRWNQPPAFSKRPPRFVIEQCVKHHAAGTEHDHTCERLYVMLVQGPDGSMAGLGDWVLDEIKRRDVQRSGYGPDDLARFCRDNQTEVLAQRAKMEKDQEESVRHASKFNRRQLCRALTLMGRHDLRVNQ
jgi:hypothetical protein